MSIAFRGFNHCSFPIWMALPSQDYLSNYRDREPQSPCTTRSLTVAGYLIRLTRPSCSVFTQYQRRVRVGFSIKQLAAKASSSMPMHPVCRISHHLIQWWSVMLRKELTTCSRFAYLCCVHSAWRHYADIRIICLKRIRVPAVGLKEDLNITDSRLI